MRLRLAHASTDAQRMHPGRHPLGSLHQRVRAGCHGPRFSVGVVKAWGIATFRRSTQGHPSTLEWPGAHRPSGCVSAFGASGIEVRP